MRGIFRPLTDGCLCSKVSSAAQLLGLSTPNLFKGKLSQVALVPSSCSSSDPVHKCLHGQPWLEENVQSSLTGRYSWPKLSGLTSHKSCLYFEQHFSIQEPFLLKFYCYKMYESQQVVMNQHSLISWRSQTPSSTSNLLSWLLGFYRITQEGSLSDVLSFLLKCSNDKPLNIWPVRHWIIMFFHEAVMTILMYLISIPISWLPLCTLLLNTSPWLLCRPSTKDK